MGKVLILDHPLIKHKITMMRMEQTNTKDFRTLVEEVTVLMGYEALSILAAIPSGSILGMFSIKPPPVIWLHPFTFTPAFLIDFIIFT